MRVFVTGAGGFVGSRLCARLAAEGVDVVACDLELDVRDAARVRAAVARARPDAVVHLAAISFVPASVGAPESVYRTNYLGSLSVLEAVRQEAPGARLLLVGSAHAYGSAEPGSPPFDETSPLCPVSPYGRSKAAADLLGGVYAERGLDVVRVRPFNHTGPGRPDQFAESSFARQLAEIECGRRAPLLEVGNLEAVRDFLDVEDVVEAYWRLLTRPTPATVFNVASERALSIGALLDLLLTHAKVRPEIRVDPSRLRPTDVSVGCARRLREATHWAPSVTLEDTLGRLLDDWRERLRVS